MRQELRTADGFETVWTLWYYCDGPREGVADYQGRSLHAYEVAPAAGNMRAWILAQSYESRPIDPWPKKHLQPTPR